MPCHAMRHRDRLAAGRTCVRRVSVMIDMSVYVCRHGKIQSVRLVPVGSDARTCSGSASASASGGGGAVVAFMDIRCASRAHDSVNTIDGSTLITMYNESSTTPAPVLSVPVAVPVAVQVPASSAPVTSSTESTPCSARDVRRHADRRSPGLNGSTGSAKCHRRSDGSVFTTSHPFINPLIATLKPHSNGPSYSNTVIGTLAVDGWAVTVGTARWGLGRATACPGLSLLYQMLLPNRQRPVYQLRIIRIFDVAL